MADRKGAPQPNGQRHDDRLSAVGFTEMEERILDGLAHGMTRSEICREQGIGHSTYDGYVAFVRRYLGVRTTTQAVVVYIRQKMKREEEGEEKEE